MDNDIKLQDAYSRRLNYLRVSITDRCNLRCIYCMPGDQSVKLTHRDVLRYEEILRLVRIGVNLGITKVRVTGGEPLVRKGVYDFLAALNEISGISDISLTTNGVLLKDNLERIKSAGIRRINISLDTLNRKKFINITGHDFFHQVWESIMAAKDLNFHPIKLNMVVLAGVNDDELIDMARLSFSYPFHIRFIEYMPIGCSHLIGHKPILAPEIKKRIERLGNLLPVENGIQDGPAERFKFEESLGEIGFIRPISRHFCEKCNRLRLTASGKLRACLLSDHYEDFKAPLRSGCLDKDLVDIFLKAVRQKPSSHHLVCDQPERVCDQMVSIGG